MLPPSIHEGSHPEDSKMKAAQVFVMVLALGVSVANAPVVRAAAAGATAIDFTAAQMDTSAAHADSSAVPATAAPATQTPPPAAVTPPPAAAPAAAATPAKASQPAGENKIYYGGTVTVGIGSTTTLGFWPMIAYKLTPKLSGGVEAGYEYVNYGDNQSTHDYGASLFGRFRVGRNLYAHAEYSQINYEIFESNNSSSREWVPALLAGGGFAKNLNARTSAYAEVLFDLLQADNSPYKNWEPVVRFGVAVGF
jgi:hypothetical protein